MPAAIRPVRGALVDFRASMSGARRILLGAMVLLLAGAGLWLRSGGAREVPSAPTTPPSPAPPVAEAPEPAAAPSLPIHPPTRRQFPVANHSVAMWMADESGTSGPLSRFFHLEPARPTASLRLAAPRDLEVVALWVHLGAVSRDGTPLPLWIGLRHDDGLGRPQQADGSEDRIEVARSAPRWLRVELVDPHSFRAGEWVHVLLRIPDGFPDESQVVLTTLRSRAPAPFVPDADGAFESRYDPALAVLVDHADGLGLHVQRGSHAAHQPVLLLEERDGRLVGQPYDQVEEPIVEGAQLAGQEFVAPRDMTVDFVAVHQRPESWKLVGTHAEIALFSLAEDGAAQEHARQRIAERTQQLYYGRAHWWGVHLDRPVALPAGSRWVLALAAPGLAPGFRFSGLRCSLPDQGGPGAEHVPTWGRELGRAVISDDGGRTFRATRAGSDLPVMLGEVGEPAPHALLDEMRADPIDDKDRTTRWIPHPSHLSPGQRVGLAMVVRNIGVPASRQMPIYCLLRDDESGEVLAAKFWRELGSNAEIGRCLEIAMRDRPLWRVTIESGHLGPDGRPVVDQLLPMEFLRLDGVTPTNLLFEPCDAGER